MKKLTAIKSDNSGNFIFFYHKKGVDVIEKSELIDVDLKRVNEHILTAPFNRNAQVSMILTILTAFIALLYKSLRKTNIDPEYSAFIEIIPSFIVAIVFAYFLSLVQYSAKQKSTVIYIMTATKVYNYKMSNNIVYSDIYLFLKPFFQKYLPKEGDHVAYQLNRKETLEDQKIGLFLLVAPRINFLLLFSAFSDFISHDFLGICMLVLLILFFINFLGNIEKVLVSITGLFQRIFRSKKERLDLFFSNSALKLHSLEDPDRYVFDNLCYYNFSLKGNNLEISTKKKRYHSDFRQLEGEYKLIDKYDNMGFVLVDYFNETSQHEIETITQRIINKEDCFSDCYLNDFLDYIANREIILEKVKSYGDKLQYVSKEFKADREIVLTAIKSSPRALEFASVELKKDPEIVLTALKLDRFSLDHVSVDLLKDHETIIESLKHVGSKILDHFVIPRELWNNRKFNLELVKQDGNTLGLLLHKFKTDREIVLEAVRERGSALKYVSKEFRGNREIVLEAVKSEGSIFTSHAFRYVSKELKRDRALVLEAVKTDARAFKYAVKELRRDRTFVMEAVKLNGLALEFAMAKFKKDREVVLAAVKSKGWALEYASEESRKDREIVIEALKIDGSVLRFASEEFRDDREIVLEAVKSNGVSLEFASIELRRDRKLVLEALKIDGQALQYLTEEFRNDREIVLEAVKSNGVSLEYASKELRRDRKLVLEAIKSEARAFNHIATPLKNDREFVLEAVKSNGLVLQFATQFSFDNAKF